MDFLQFHWYGFWVGLGVSVGLFLAEFQAKKYRISDVVFWSTVSWLLVGGIIGARFYHVATDFPLYQSQLWMALAIWRGGLSIIGAVIGGLVALLIYFLIYPKERKDAKLYLDLPVFGLPIGQAIGRLGNWANQELYGLPTTLPWGIWIDQSHRLPGFTQFNYFHPLFAYEALLLIGFGVATWWWGRKWVGTGKLFLTYILYYSIIRFALDFLRIDKATLPWLHLGVNQGILLLIIFSCIIFLVMKKISGFKKLVISFLIGAVVLSGAILIQRSQVITPSFSDHQRVHISVGTQPLEVEVVNSAQSITQGLSGRDTIGADGMLFILNKRQIPQFWMKEMWFDLDLIWVADEQIVEITAQVPKPAANESIKQLPLYSPKTPVTLVLEVAAGQAAQWQLKPGDKLHFLP